MMENRPLPSLSLADRMHSAYNDLFSALPVSHGVIVSPQMPDFQLALFTNQAVARHVPVRVQLNPVAPDQPITSAIGYLRVTANHRLILSQPNSTVTTLIEPSLMRYIALISQD